MVKGNTTETVDEGRGICREREMTGHLAIIVISRSEVAEMPEMVTDTGREEVRPRARYMVAMLKKL